MRVDHRAWQCDLMHALWQEGREALHVSTGIHAAHTTDLYQKIKIYLYPKCFVEHSLVPPRTKPLQ